MQTHAIHIARYLHGLGHSIEVVTYRARQPQEAAAFDRRLGFPVHRILSRLSHHENLRLVAAMCEGSDALYASTVYYGLLSDRLPVYCRSAGNDVLRPWIAYPFERFSGLVAAPFVDGTLYHYFVKWKRPDFVHAWFRDARFRLMRRALHGNTHIFANSHFTGDLLRDLGFLNYSVVPGGVDASEFCPPVQKAEGLVYLTACRLVAKKGIDTFLQAAAIVRAHRPDARFVIVGDGPQRQALERASNGLAVFTGRIPHEEMKRQYWSASCFVLPSRDHVHKRTGLRDVETMGRVLCEANAAGVPVIASRTGGIPSIVEDGYNGLLTEPGNASQLADAMLRVAEDRPLALRLAANGLEMAKTKFDWPIVLGQQADRLTQARQALSACVPSPRDV
jgi:glycosyltransferase involved in cell wall biosynthesis